MTEKIYIDKEFEDKIKKFYMCKDCGFISRFENLSKAIDVLDTLKKGIKVEVIFCGRCGSENLE